MKSPARARGPRWTSEDDRARRLRDVLVYEIQTHTGVVRGKIQMRLFDSGGIADVTLPADDVVIAGPKAFLNRAVVIAHGLGLPLRVERAHDR